MITIIVGVTLSLMGLLTIPLSIHSMRINKRIELNTTSALWIWNRSNELTNITSTTMKAHSNELAIFIARGSRGIMGVEQLDKGLAEIQKISHRVTGYTADIKDHQLDEDIWAMFKCLMGTLHDRTDTLIATKKKILNRASLNSISPNVIHVQI